MGIQLASAGNRVPVGSQKELYQNRGSASQTRIYSEIKFVESLPGNNAVAQYTNIPVDEDLDLPNLIFNKKLKFYVDQDSHEVIVKVIDSETDKVIKVLPPEELQRLHARLKEAIGFLFDEQV
jgi:flagellar protein FlaG